MVCILLGLGLQKGERYKTALAPSISYRPPNGSSIAHVFCNRKENYAYRHILVLSTFEIFLVQITGTASKTIFLSLLSHKAILTSHASRPETGDWQF